MESEKSIKEIVDDIQKLEKPVKKVQASDFCLYDFIDRLSCGFAEVDLYTCDSHSNNSYICTFNLSNCEHILKIYGPCSVYEWNFKPKADCALTVSIVNDVSDVLHKGITKEDWDMRSKIISEYIHADDIKPDDEWMQDNKWDDIYKKKYGNSVATQQEELGTVHVSDGEWKGVDVNDCPFCGGDASLCINGNAVFVKCNNCGCKSHFIRIEYGGTEAITAVVNRWNERVGIKVKRDKETQR